ncbi:MAG: DUF447 family protein [Methanocalculus sp. MSAO_Arc1]|uniref:DUF447 domain-containing protein n=1 Tax=Methanocalculus TaxID=71151 RepID=UPI000FEF7907|nr:MULTISPECIES: DUF447 domain-containing protein [unclassified Methanocalculus]MCP1661837.1 hypothetical protein [Methanocalculus sp. AMF5]RQD81970.1 MAG: DUF447 family protein [Methanocalculus sp. MSAO_Arc1]
MGLIPSPTTGPGTGTTDTTGPANTGPGTSSTRSTILREGINEVIGTTHLNAAPMGVIYRNGKFALALFKGSHTAENIVRDGWFVANIIHDPVIYVETAFGDLADDSFVPEVIDGMEMHRLAAAEAWVAFRAAVVSESSEAYSITLTPVREEVRICSMYPVNRGFNAIIEAAVHGTRYLMNHDPDLKWLIDHHLAIARKCGGEREKVAARMVEYVIGKKENGV